MAKDVRSGDENARVGSGGRFDAEDGAAADAGGSADSAAIDGLRLRAAPAARVAESLKLVTDAIDDGLARRGSGSRRARDIVGARPLVPGGTLAITASIGAAARRGALVGGGVRLSAADLMQHRRRGAGITQVLFLVDASGSMATQRRLELAKGAALGLLTSSYQRRDEVALMVFRGDGSDLVMPFTRHIDSVEKTLAALPTGGRTPLAQALADATDLLHDSEPTLLVLLTDGRANVSRNGGDPWQESLAACGPMLRECAGALVIDCERGPIFLGRARELARALDADCIALDELDSAALTLRIHRRFETL